MNKERKLIIAGNWKMNKTVAEALALVSDLKRDLASVKEVDLVVCPPFTALESVSKAVLDSNLRLGAKKAAAAHAASLKPIVCAGETLAEREAGQTENVLDTQVRGSLEGLTKE